MYHLYVEVFVSVSYYSLYFPTAVILEAFIHGNAILIEASCNAEPTYEDI